LIAASHAATSEHALKEVTVSSSRRERERARKRHEKRLARQAAAAKKRRRNNIIGAVSAGVVAVAAVAVIVVLANRDPAPPPADADTVATEPADGSTASVPDPGVAEAREWTGTITTSGGPIDITLDGAKAPQAVANFVVLAQDGFFNGTNCHRVTTDGIFVLQCGDPEGTGSGGPGYTWGPIENPPADGIYPAGTIAMARGAEADSMGSQFFLVYKDTKLPTEGGGYTIFGSVTSGLDVVQTVADAGVEGGSTDGTPASPITIEGVAVQ
jgi:peptidyl-prolyl cis-trans isomerase B (cyclophilin B)